MAETFARVVSVTGENALVEPAEPPGCDACASGGGGCGAMSIGRIFTFSPRRYRAINRIAAQPGDKVVVAVAEGAIWRGAVAGYLMPLALLLGGALAGGQAFGGDGGAIVGAAAGLAASGLWLSFFSRRTTADGRYSPTIVRRDGDSMQLLKGMES